VPREIAREILLFLRGQYKTEHKTKFVPVLEQLLKATSNLKSNLDVYLVEYPDLAQCYPDSPYIRFEIIKSQFILNQNKKKKTKEIEWNILETIPSPINTTH
jgi:hypothetical protein